MKSGTTQSAVAVTQIVASSVVRNLAKFTNVDDGVLAGGWTVITKKSHKAPRLKPKQARAGFNINKTRSPSLQSIERIDSIKKAQDVIIGNNIFYGPFVNDGTRRIRAYRFVERSVRTSQAELLALGIKIEVKRG